MPWDSTTRRAAIPLNTEDARAAGGCAFDADIVQTGDWNMWAKYKFVEKAGYYQLTGKSSGSDYWKGTNGQCGIIIPKAISLGDPNTVGTFLYKLLNDPSELAWSYDRPSSLSLYDRIRDLDGYWADARALTVQTQIASYNLASDGSLTIQWPMAPIAEGETDQLRFTDIAVNNQLLSNWYFGALIYDINAHTWVVSAPATIAANGLSVTFTGVGSYAGRSVYIVPFLSSGQINSGGTPGGITLISYNLPPITATINAHVGKWEITGARGAYNLAGTRVSYTVRVKNNNSAAGNMNVYIDLSDTADGSHILATTTRQIASLAQGTTEVLTGDITWAYDSSKAYYLIVEGSYGSGLSYEYIQRSIYQVARPMEPEPIISE